MENRSLSGGKPVKGDVNRRRDPGLPIAGANGSDGSRHPSSLPNAKIGTTRSTAGWWVHVVENCSRCLLGAAVIRSPARLTCLQQHDLLLLAVGVTQLCRI